MIFSNCKKKEPYNHQKTAIINYCFRTYKYFQTPVLRWYAYCSFWHTRIYSLALSMPVDTRACSQKEAHAINHVPKQKYDHHPLKHLHTHTHQTRRALPQVSPEFNFGGRFCGHFMEGYERKGCIPERVGHIEIKEIVPVGKRWKNENGERLNMAAAQGWWKRWNSEGEMCRWKRGWGICSLCIAGKK